MFSQSQIESLVESDDFQADRSYVQQALAEIRYGQDSLFDQSAISRLRNLVECVLASAPGWQTSGRTSVCRLVGELAELLAHQPTLSDADKKRCRLRASLLYELGDAPAVSSALLHEADLSAGMLALMRREGPFERLNGHTLAQPEVTPEGAFSIGALEADAHDVAKFLQGQSDERSGFAADALALLGRELNLDLTATELRALSAVLAKRTQDATRSHVADETLESLRQIRFPAELWTSQSQAIDQGLLDPSLRSWGMAAPTGTGKSFLTQVLIAEVVQSEAEALALYLVPSKALVYEVSSRLGKQLQPLDVSVTAVTPQLVDLDSEEREAIEQASVLVLTPEKADLLLRLSAEVFDRTAAVIVDEAHHIESGTRGVLLEMYLWRLKKMLPSTTRLVFLSAVAPNIEQLTQWGGEPHRAVVNATRPTRMRVGLYCVRKSGRSNQGWIDYADGTKLLMVPPRIETTQRRKLAQLAEAVGVAGPVLVVAKGKKECENLAREMQKRLNPEGSGSSMSDDEYSADLVQRLDSRLEREMYSDVPMRGFLRDRIVYHHAGLPPRVRVAVEDAIRAGMIRYVFATTTLAEGVNFPFSSVIVQSLALREPPVRGRPTRYSPVTPRVFWNIAGRAGRPGTDREGQVILFEPSLGLERVHYVLNDYTNPELTSIEPVRSALADGLNAIMAGVDSGEVEADWMSRNTIPEQVPREIHGTVNLLRVSLLHARASGIGASPEEILEGTFAYQFIAADKRTRAQGIFRMQEEVVGRFLEDPSSPSPKLAAELGLSIETLTALQQYAREREHWQLDNMKSVLHGGVVNQDQAAYVLAPVASRMAELEGGKLGGFLAPVILQWLMGVPFSKITRERGSIEELISVIYSRVQFLLPWGLYAFDRVVERECEDRGITYNNEIRSLAYLVDAGVPSFDGLRLVNGNFERVDAARLARAYRDEGGLSLGIDVIAWVASRSDEELASVVAGPESRRIDHDFLTLVSRARGSVGSA